jgi:predicted nucleic acid-binding protein
LYLLDTNVLSELRKPRPHGGVLAWLREVEGRSVYLSAVTIGELQAGVELTREQDAAKATAIENWVDDIIEHWAILPVDTAVFRVWAKLMHRRPEILISDAMIAATALVYGFAVVTRNTRHFKDFGVALIDPFATR